MRPEVPHPWQVSRPEAAAIQLDLAPRVVMQALPAEGSGSPRFAAGVDVSYAKDGSRAWAAAVVMDRRFKILAKSVVEGTPDSPYEPGYLAFREGRLTLDALVELVVEPELIFLDSHGVVHERGLGMASHVGVVLWLPTIGVAKSPFFAVKEQPGPGRGQFHVLDNAWGAQGACIRLKRNVKPVYVSPGHLVDLASSVTLALVWSSGRRRVPEPLAMAHTLSLEARNAAC